MDEVIMDLGAKQKSFKCNECEQEFQRSNDLKNHLKRDHKKPKELPKLHSGRTTHYNCPECNKPLPSAREVKLHLDKEHKKTQAFLGGNEDLDLSVTRKKPTASKQQQATRKNKRGLSSSKWQESFIGQLWLSARMEQQSQQESSTKEVA